MRAYRTLYNTQAADFVYRQCDCGIVNRQTRGCQKKGSSDSLYCSAYRCPTAWASGGARRGLPRYFSQMETGEEMHLPAEKPEELVFPYASPLEELRTADSKPKAGPRADSRPGAKQEMI